VPLTGESELAIERARRLERAGESRPLQAPTASRISRIHERRRPRLPWCRNPRQPQHAQWHRELGVGLTGAFLCSQAFNVDAAPRRPRSHPQHASDLSAIAADERLCRKDGTPEDQQPVKLATYSVIKTGLAGLTRYLAAYWAAVVVRVNALSPGGSPTDSPRNSCRAYRTDPDGPHGSPRRIPLCHPVSLLGCVGSQHSAAFCGSDGGWPESRKSPAPPYGPTSGPGTFSAARGHARILMSCSSSGSFTCSISAPQINQLTKHGPQIHHQMSAY
jgi:hypothetical protein